MKRKALVVFGVAIMFGFLFSSLERSMIYHPTPLRGETPAQYKIPFQAVNFPTPDGESLQGWWMPRPEPDAPRLLFVHGNAGNREDRLHNLAGLWQAGISVFIFDYRGYGGSTGSPDEEGIVTDGVAAFDWLAATSPDGTGETGRPEGSAVALFGRSLGGAVAAQVALRRPAAALILESTFTSVSEMARKLFPIPGVQWLVRTRLDTGAAMARLRLPLLVIHGDADDLVPFQMGEALYQTAASPEKTFHPVAGGGHNDTYLIAGGAYFPLIAQFLGRHARP